MVEEQDVVQAVVGVDAASGGGVGDAGDLGVLGDVELRVAAVAIIVEISDVSGRAALLEMVAEEVVGGDLAAGNDRGVGLRRQLEAGFEAFAPGVPGGVETGDQGLAVRGRSGGRRRVWRGGGWWRGR